jgi:hypothetical protein
MACIASKRDQEASGAQRASELERTRTVLRNIEAATSLRAINITAALEDLNQFHTAKLREEWHKVLHMEVQHFVTYLCKAWAELVLVFCRVLTPICADVRNYTCACQSHFILAKAMLREQPKFRTVSETLHAFDDAPLRQCICILHTTTRHHELFCSFFFLNLSVLALWPESETSRQKT